VLCNVAGANATELAHRVADIYLGDRLKPAPAPQVTAVQFAAAAGLYRSTMTGEALRIGSERRILGSRTWTFDGRGATATDEHGIVETFDRVTPATPTLEDLQAYAGTYDSDEAETTMTAAVENGKLVLKRRPDVTLALTPSYVDAFTGPQVNTVIFRRVNAGRVIALSVVQDRVWDMRFTRRTR
jgi:hypothetical protein